MVTVCGPPSVHGCTMYNLYRSKQFHENWLKQMYKSIRIPKIRLNKIMKLKVQKTAVFILNKCCLIGH